MLTEQAQVVAVEAEGVRVETVRRSGCAGCQSKSVCGQRLLAEIGQGQRFQIVSSNPQHIALKPGDIVELGVQEAPFLQASAMIYLFPLVGLILAAVVAEMAAFAESGVVVSGLLGLFLGFGGVWSWSRSSNKQCRYQPQIVRLKS
tara:strand:- start:2200 stop:2637 length:438 start_codon:yes stop_codon:yes gene_type:complete